MVLEVAGRSVEKAVQAAHALQIAEMGCRSYARPSVVADWFGEHFASEYTINQDGDPYWIGSAWSCALSGQETSC